MKLSNPTFQHYTVRICLGSVYVNDSLYGVHIQRLTDGEWRIELADEWNNQLFYCREEDCKIHVHAAKATRFQTSTDARVEWASNVASEIS